MGSYNPELQQVVGVDPVEVFVGHLTHYGPFPTEDPDEGNILHFYDGGCDIGDGLPYTLQSVLEYYFNNERSVKITVEDAGPADPGKQEREKARAAEHERALVALEGEVRARARSTHRPRY